MDNESQRLAQRYLGSSENGAFNVIIDFLLKKNDVRLEAVIDHSLMTVLNPSDVLIRHVVVSKVVNFFGSLDQCFSFVNARR